MKWHEALKRWNAHHKSINPAHVFALPRRGTPEHAEVMKIIADSKGGAAAAPAAPRESRLPPELRGHEAKEMAREAKAKTPEAKAALEAKRKARSDKALAANLKKEAKKGRAKAAKEGEKSQRDKILELLQTEFVGRGRK